MSVEAMLRRLGVDPAALEPAPADPDRVAAARVGLDARPCASCARPATVTEVIEPGRGRCWLDRCGRCLVATEDLEPPRGPATVAEAVAGLREVAAETGMELQIMTGAPARFHLVLYTGDRPTMHGWWDAEATARRKFTSWIGEHGRPGARIDLVDEETGTVLTTWPDAA